jgi:hypothetical protein
MPAAIDDLRYEWDPDGVTLSWSWPRLTEKGAALRRIRQFIVERASEPARDFCPECPRRYSQIGLVEGGLRPEQGVAQIVIFHDRELRPGYYYTYRVRSSLGWRVISAPSEPVALTWQVGLTAPEDLTARAGEQEVALEWRAPARDLEGVAIVEPVFYQVYRRQAGENYSLLDEVRQEAAYIDRQVSSGVTYEYRVRAARVSGGTGAFSEVAAATPSDLTPPPPPFGLTAVVSRQEVHLYWQPLPSSDLAGYQIYRRRQAPGSSGQLLLIGQVDARVNTFTDSTPFNPAGEVRYYRLRAFDRATPPNLSEFSPEIETQPVR